MTAFLGTDPKNGSAWAGGTADPVTNTQSNQILNWIDGIDRSHELRSVMCVPGWYTAAGGDAVSCACYDATHSLWFLGGDDSADGSSAVYRAAGYFDVEQDATITDVGELLGIASNGSGTIIACGDDTADSADKILSSTNGTTWTLRSLSTNYADSCRGAIWDPSNGKFVVSVAFYLEYSSNGTTWTQCTADNTIGYLRYMATNGDGRTIAVPSNSEASLLVTDDCITWTNRRMTTGSHKAAAWSGSDLLFFIVTNTVIEQSEHGDKWITGDATLPSDVATVKAMTATTNLVLLAYGDGTSYWLAASDDACRTWRKVMLYPGMPTFLEYADGQLCTGYGTGTVGFSLKAMASL